jgi:hypothetical protein
MSKAIAVQCTAISKQSGQQCKRKAIPGGTVCRYHGGGAQQVKAKAAVRAELLGWGLGDATVDPGEVLLRLVTQSAARAERYAMLLQEAFEAAERLKQAHDAGAEIEFRVTSLPTPLRLPVVILIASSTQAALLPLSATRTEQRRMLASM